MMTGKKLKKVSEKSTAKLPLHLKEVFSILLEKTGLKGQNYNPGDFRKPPPGCFSLLLRCGKSLQPRSGERGRIGVGHWVWCRSGHADCSYDAGSRRMGCRNRHHTRNAQAEQRRILLRQILPTSHFRKHPEKDLPFPEASFDVVISNGVFNLIPDKLKALNEVFRVLKPSGRLMIADQILTTKPSDDIESQIDNWAG